jgi:hypothetical protein
MRAADHKLIIRTFKNGHKIKRLERYADGSKFLFSATTSLLREHKPKTYP